MEASSRYRLVIVMQMDRALIWRSANKTTKTKKNLTPYLGSPAKDEAMLEICHDGWSASPLFFSATLCSASDRLEGRENNGSSRHAATRTSLHPANFGIVVFTAFAILP